MTNDLEKLQGKLKNIEKDLTKFSTTNSVSFGQAFTDKFMTAHTKFKNLDQFWNAAGFKNVSFEDASQEQLDKFTNKNSEFKDFQSMIDAATSEWVKEQVGNILNQ